MISNAHVSPSLYNSTLLPTGPMADQSDKWSFWNRLLSHKTERYSLLGRPGNDFRGVPDFWNFWNGISGMCVRTGIESGHLVVVSS